MPHHILRYAVVALWPTLMILIMIILLSGCAAVNMIGPCLRRTMGCS